MNREKIAEYCRILREGHKNSVKQGKFLYWKDDACCALGLIFPKQPEYENCSVKARLWHDLFGDVQFIKEYGSGSERDIAFERFYSFITSLNDSGKNFAEIADELEKKYLFPVAAE